MNEVHLTRIAGELKIGSGQVRATASLLAEGGTVPFISRYRKEATGSLDEVAVAAIRDRLEQLGELDKRREAILKSLEERDLLSDELRGQVNGAETLAALEDIYLPYRPKRRTRATAAREKGLQPLADALVELDGAREPFDEAALAAVAAQYVDEEKGVASAVEALDGARDIIAEFVSEHADARRRMRDLYLSRGVISSRLKEKADKKAAKKKTSAVEDPDYAPPPEDNGAAKFRDYFEWDEPAAKAPSHRVLAMYRGENEGFLALRIAPPDAEALPILSGMFVKGANAASAQLAAAVEDSYKRLLGPSMETEVRGELKRRADEEAIRVFAENLRELLLAPPLGRTNVLALDPGFRTGCKLVCLDRQGKLTHNDAIYPHTGGHRAAEAGDIVRALCSRFEIEAIAIGNGTASRETESFVRGLNLPSSITVVMVNESGASIYSASEAAREEFPDHDVTVRGAVSIGRRLLDPLAELVKIDPKSIGVGQYQHDVDQAALKRSLDDVVISCVNGVGVDVNSASKQLLTYVSGLGPQLAGNIVAYRNENGPFASRAALKKVPRLGPKAFEQSAGFLRVSGAKNPLDASAVHPESYAVVDAIAADLKCTVAELVRDEPLRAQIDLNRYVSDKTGLPTLRDIMAELAKPGRDPRKTFEVFSFAEGVNKLEDLSAGMCLPGIVTNVTAFGAFVDVGVHQDGLVHISQLADRFVKEPAEVVKVQQQVTVTVLEVDAARRRIALSMRKDPGAPPKREQREPKPREQRQPEPRDLKKLLNDKFKRR